MDEIEDIEWIIWNSAIGIRDFVTIGEVDDDENIAWLESPYQMVGPFSIKELLTQGQISFAKCVVMSKQKWQDERESLLAISMMRRRKAQQEFFEELEKQNRRRHYNHTDQLEEYRILLDLPISGMLEIKQIKSAYKKAAKKAHPDAGGTQEMFLQIKEACDVLLESTTHSTLH